MPFVLAALAAMHILTLHEHGSSNPLGVTGNTDRLPFHPYFTFKDLVNHAFFKALLFLAAGGVLHSMADQQDLRRLGGLVGLLPVLTIESCESWECH